MGVLTHLDGFKDSKKLNATKKALKHRFWTEVAHGSKLFYLSGIKYGRYLKREVLNLARFISVAKARPLSWRVAHPYLVVDRFEDVTPREAVRAQPKCDRTVSLYGFLRGCNLRRGQRVHVAGVDDFDVAEVDLLPDPCPMPDTIKKRGLNEQERLVYGPMSNVGGVLYDRDAVYIDLPDWKLRGTGAALQEARPALPDVCACPPRHFACHAGPCRCCERLTRAARAGREHGAGAAEPVPDGGRAARQRRDSAVPGRRRAAG